MAVLRDGAAESAVRSASARPKSHESTETDGLAPPVRPVVPEPAATRETWREISVRLVAQAVTRCQATGSPFLALLEVTPIATQSTRAVTRATGAIEARMDPVDVTTRLRRRHLHPPVVRRDMGEVTSTEAAAEVDLGEEEEEGRSGNLGRDRVTTAESRLCERIGAGSVGARRALAQLAARGGRSGRGGRTSHFFRESKRKTE